jgi:methyl-accepting chemotaxis protein
MGPRPDRRAAAPARCPPDHEESRCARCADALRVHTATTRLLVTHLRAVIERTEAAANEIVAALLHTHEEVKAIVSTLEAATAASHRQHEGGPEGMATLQGCMDRRAREVEVERARLRQVADRANEMKTLLAGMGEFSMSAKILALNARVEAARAGNAGRAFGVVADEMSRVAETTKAVTIDLGARAATLARTMNSALEAQVNDLERSNADERLALDAVARGLSAALVDKHAFLDALGARSTSLAQRSMVGLASVQFQDIVRQRLELVIAVLGELDAHVDGVVAHAEGDDSVDLDARLGALDAMVMKERYVMRSQREDHARVVGVAMVKGDDGPDVELF